MACRAQDKQKEACLVGIIAELYCSSHKWFEYSRILDSQTYVTPDEIRNADLVPRLHRSTRTQPALFNVYRSIVRMQRLQRLSDAYTWSNLFSLHCSGLPESPEHSRSHGTLLSKGVVREHASSFVLFWRARHIRIHKCFGLKQRQRHTTNMQMFWSK